jgi:Icc-related predicted phosphoesterase
MLTVGGFCPLVSMKILAVSDIPSRSLETLVADGPGRFRNINLIVSCGDLGREYLEFLVDGLNKEFFFVTGNHPFDMQAESSAGDFHAERAWEKVRGFHGKAPRYLAGRADLHGRVEVFRNYLITGFGGSQWYNGNENQYREQEMAKIVRDVERKIKWYRLQEKFLGMPPREVIVVSHAPVLNIHDQSDPCHTGFQCFRDFIDRVSPALWIHGHIHLQDLHRNQISLAGRTTVINAYGCKVIDVDRREITVCSHCSVDK